MAQETKEGYAVLSVVGCQGRVISGGRNQIQARRGSDFGASPANATTQILAPPRGVEVGFWRTVGAHGSNFARPGAAPAALPAPPTMVGRRRENFQIWTSETHFGNKEFTISWPAQAQFLGQLLESEAGKSLVS